MTRPLVSHIPTVKDMVMLHSDHPKASEAKGSVQASLDALGSIHILYRSRTFTTFLKFSPQPRASGPSSGTLYGSTPPRDQVSGHLHYPLWGRCTISICIAYDSENERTRLVPMARMRDLFLCKQRHWPILSLIQQNPSCTLDFLASSFDCSKATMSRNVAIYRQLELVEREGSGRGGSPYRIRLTEWGNNFLSYTHM